MSFFHLTCFANRAIFNWVSKSIRDCICFALLRSEIDPQKSVPLSQPIRKLNPITTWFRSQRFPTHRVIWTVFLLSSHQVIIGIFLSSHWPF